MPAILVADINEFYRQILTLSPYFQHYQIDIADDIFVPNKTIQVDDIISSLPNNKYPIPNNLNFDFHLMVKDYEKEIEKLKKLAKILHVNNVLIHVGAIKNSREFQQLSNRAIEQFSVGPVLNPEDKVEDVAQKFDLQKFPLIQIMTVSPGFQGSLFIPEMLNKVTELRQTGYKSKVFIDGAVNNQTIPIILSQKYKPDVLGVGSYLSKAGKKLEERVKYLKTITTSLIPAS